MIDLILEEPDNAVSIHGSQSVINMKIKKLFKVLFFLVNILLLPQIVMASDAIKNPQLISLSKILLAESSACRSCIRSYACDRSNKVCQKNCQANLYTKDEDLESCSQSCTSEWSKCEVNAKKACGSYYCSSKG